MMDPLGSDRAEPRWLDVVRAGVLSGLTAGLAVALLAMFRSALVGLGVWLPMKLIAGVYFGVEALLGDAGVIIVGVLIHFSMSAVLGVLFSLFTRGRPEPTLAAVAGVVYGILIWTIVITLVLPWANPTMFERVSVAMSWFFLQHVVFGLTLGLGPGIGRGSHHRIRRIEHGAPAGVLDD